MAGLSDLFGRHGVIEQLLLWNVVGQVISAAGQPGFELLGQDVNAKHPVQILDPGTLAQLVARSMVGKDAAEAEAARSGIDAERFGKLLDRETIRLAPADLAMAVLRSYMTQGAAEADAKPQGVTPAMLKILSDLAGDAPGPDELAVALRRHLIREDGKGPESTSYEQGIAETRLHNKWGPVVRELARQLISPADASSAVIRNFMSREAGVKAAELQGVDADTFDILTHLSGDAPGPQQLAEALRRGAIKLDGTGAGSTSFEQGIAEGRLADKWAPVIRALAQMWPTPDDALNAVLKGDIPSADGEAMYEKLGGDPQFYPWLLSSIGDAPSPLEAASMAARGIIEWEGTGPDNTSFAQAVREGRLRDKWTPAVKASTVFLPTPGEVITFLSEGSMTRDRAAGLLAQHRMTEEQIGWYLNEADLAATTDYRGLTRSSVIDMYKSRMISSDDAVGLLEALHISGDAAKLLLSYADMQQVYANVQESVRRIASLYTSRKITSETAISALSSLGIPQPGIEDIMQTWRIQAAASVKTLTATQIAESFLYEAMTQPEAMTELENIGYTPFDAWVVLCITVKAVLPDKPTRTIGAPPLTVIPGTT